MRKYLFVFLLILFIPFTVLGDAAGPYIIEYDAVIINKKGIEYEDENGDKKTVPYNSKVRVIYESDESVELIYYDKNNNKISINTSINDIMPYDKEINPHTYKKHDDGWDILSKENSSIIVFAKDGLKLRKGPSEKWDEYADTIDYMTVLDTTYTMYGSMIHGEAGNLWFYVENDKYHGWIDTSKIGYKIDNTILTFQDVKLKDDSNNVITTIPVETVLKEIYRIESKKQFYVKYNFEQGYIDLNYWDDKNKKDVHLFDFGYELTDYVLSKKDIKLTSMNGEVRSTIPFGTRIEVLYADIDDSDLGCLYGPRGYLYVKYKDKQGFIKESDVFIDDYSELDSKFIPQNFTVTNDIQLYELSSKKELATISANTKINSPYCYIDSYNEDGNYYQEEWCVIKHDNNIGKILTKRIKNDIVIVNNTNQKDKGTIVKADLRLENIYIENYYIDFNKQQRQYTIKIKDEKSLNIRVLKEIETDKVEIIGNEDLKNGSIIKIIVSRGNESIKYFINIEKDSFFKTHHILTYCVIGAITLAIISLGIILLINRKKKSKKEEIIVKNIEEKNTEVPKTEEEHDTSKKADATLPEKEESKVINNTATKVKSVYKNKDKNIKNYKTKRKQSQDK